MKIFQKTYDENRIIFKLFGFLKFKTKNKALSIKGVSAKNTCAWEKLIYPSETFKMPEMKDIFGKRHKHFEGYECKIPPFYVRGFKNGICYTNREEVFTSPGEVIEEYTTQKKNPQIGQPHLDITNIKRVEGTVAHLSLSNLENNYFHWLIECLGRLYLIRKSGITPDYYIVSNHTPFQKQYLQMLGLKEEQIIPTNSNELIQADELIVPSFINNWEYVNYRGYKHYQKKWLPSWIGNLYKEEILPQIETTEKKRIYISRENAPYRKILNEPELISILKEYDFEIVKLEKMKVAEQIQTFKNAEIIVGILGAGLTNAIFADTNCTVLEITTQYFLDSAYRILDKTVNIKHEYFIGETKDTKLHPQQENVFINPNTFKKVLEKLIKGEKYDT